MGSIIRKAKNMYKIVEENYITKVGGTLTKTAEEIGVYTTDGDISLYSNTSIEMKAEEEIVLGEYVDPPEPKEILSATFIAAIQFYRSKEHIDGKYGTKDSSYKGAFGFDKFDPKIHAEGLAQYYQKLGSIQPTKKVLEQNIYFCPHISLWPPQPNKNPSRASSKATLYIQAEEATTKIDAKGKVMLKSSNPSAIKVPTTPIELEIGGAPKAVTIECLNVFAQEVVITVTSEGDPAKKIGKLIVYPNDVRYKTIIQPVEIKFSTTESKVVTKRPHTPFFKSLLKDFNTTAFNQAYIYGELATDTHQITLTKAQFNKFFTNEADGNQYLIKKNETDSTTQEYSALVENRYASLLVNKVGQIKAEEQLKRTINALLIAFDNEYRDKGKVEKQHKNKIAKEAWGHQKVVAAYTAYQNALSKYKNTGKAGRLKKTDTIHLFYSTEIHAARNPSAKVLAYSSKGTGVAHVFNAALIANKPNPDVLHEIGHSLGLDHTFDSDKLGKYEDRQSGKTYKEDVEKEIDELKDKIGRTKDRIKVLNKGNDFRAYLEIENATQNKSWFLKNIDGVKSQFIDKIFEAIAFEEQPFVTNNSAEITKLNADITKTKTKIVTLEKKTTTDDLKTYPNSKSQSKTIENYMDYPQNTSGTANSDMERKVFYKWQWEQMRTVGKNKYFKQLP